ncbi:MAG: hypothetical protein Q9209_006107 [Squamulea sp. 1 TL-2023]
MQLFMTLIIWAFATINGLIPFVLASHTTSVGSSLRVVPDTDHFNGPLEARADYEPGDTLDRTMCFCTKDNSLEQMNNDPYTFYNVSENHQMGYVYQFKYYNHRLDKTFLVTDDKTCTTSPSPSFGSEPFWHNDCIKWQSQTHDFCHTFDVDVKPTVGLSKKDWRFCYHFRGDDLTDGSKKDQFEFDDEKRDLPRRRDYVGTAGEVDAKCWSLCTGTLGMEMFETHYGGYFSRMEGFHVSFAFFFLVEGGPRWWRGG